MGVLEIRTYDQLAIVSNCRVSVAQLVARSGLYREVLGSIPSTDILLFDCLMLYYTIYCMQLRLYGEVLSLFPLYIPCSQGILA